MTTFEELAVAAYKTERVIGRRLAKRIGICEEDALRQILETVAGERSLHEFVSSRMQAKIDAEAKIIAREQDKADRMERKLASKRPDATAWLAWFDGSTHPNPGKMGIGGLLQSPDGQTVEISFAGGQGNSNDAEYLALIAVLEAGIRLRPAKLVIYGDSQVVIGEMTMSGGIGARSLRHHFQHAKQLLSQLESVTLTWIPRKKNSAADTLSQQAIDVTKKIRPHTNGPG
jgi:ribonuclease HI